MGKPRIEEVGVGGDTYLFFYFYDDVPSKVVLRLVVRILILTNCERIAGFSYLLLQVCGCKKSCILFSIIPD